MVKHTYLLVIFLMFAGSLLAEEVGKVDPAATFVKTDEKTSGNWKGVYGTDAAIIIADAENAPKYAKVTAPDKLDYTWADTSDDERALKKSAADSKDRLAACWYHETAFDIDINLTDGNEHQVAIYCVDWDSETREMTIEVQNAATGAKLDSQVVKAFHGGKYLVWKLKGHVKLHITNSGQPNAVVSGILFDAVAKPAK